MSPLYVSFPFPEETLSILSTTKSEIVIQALTPKFDYQELDYIDAKTYVEPHEVGVHRNQVRDARYRRAVFTLWCGRRSMGADQSWLPLGRTLREVSAAG